jgi:hypothetical protein
MQNRAPVERQRLFITDAEKIQIRLVGESALAVQLAHPHRDRRAVGDQLEALFAFAQCLVSEDPVGDINMRANQPQWLAVRTALDLGFGGDPPDLAIAGADDAVLRGELFCRSVHRIQKVLDGAVAVLRMQARDPVSMAIDGIRRQAVNGEIFRGSLAVAETITKVDGDPGNPDDPPNAGKLSLAILQRPLGDGKRFVPTTQLVFAGA